MPESSRLPIVDRPSHLTEAGPGPGATDPRPLGVYNRHAYESERAKALQKLAKQIELIVA